MINIKFDKFSYHNQIILENVNLSFEEGSINAVIGSNGSGKSTFLSIITSANKAVNYESNLNDSFKIGYVPQDNPLLNDSTAFDNLFLWYKGSKKDFIKELESPLIQMLGINDFLKKPVKKLSGGMKKRLSIAIALINKPNILILDEPSAALDLIVKNDIKNYLIKFKEASGTVIITSHDEDELSICDNIFVIKNKNIKKLDKVLIGAELIKEL